MPCGIFFLVSFLWFISWGPNESKDRPRVEAEAVTYPTLQSLLTGRAENRVSGFGLMVCHFLKGTVLLLRQPFGIWGNNRILDFSNCH